jgi:hypothetical protein
MATQPMSLKSLITSRRSIMCGIALANVIVIQTGEWRLEDNARRAYLWTRWKLRGTGAMFAITFTASVGTTVRNWTLASPSVTSKPLPIALHTHLSYASPRHDLLYIRFPFNLVSSGCFKCCNIEREKNNENLIQSLQSRRKPAACEKQPAQ